MREISYVFHDNCRLLVVEEIDVMLLPTETVSDDHAEDDQSVHATCAERK